ncbi:MAG: hypothetical protein WA441_05150 [Methyloceanibacter sp.]
MTDDRRARDAKRKADWRQRQKDGRTILQIEVPDALASTLMLHGLLAEEDLEDKAAIARAYEAFTEDVCRGGRTIPMILEARKPSPPKKSQTYKWQKRPRVKMIRRYDGPDVPDYIKQRHNR